MAESVTHEQIYRELGIIETRLATLETRQSSIENKLDDLQSGFDQIQGGKAMALWLLAAMGTVSAALGGLGVYLGVK